MKFWRRRSWRLKQSWRQMRKIRKQSQIKFACWQKSSTKLSIDSRRREMRWRKSMIHWRRVKLVNWKISKKLYLDYLIKNILQATPKSSTRYKFSWTLLHQRLTSRMTTTTTRWKRLNFLVSKKNRLQNSFIVNIFICFCSTRIAFLAQKVLRFLKKIFSIWLNEKHNKLLSL